MRPVILNFAVRGDERGRLVAVEGVCGVPFEIRRVYYIWGTLAGVRRGNHAHLRTRQAALCLAGACSFLLDDGHSSCTLRLDRRDRALLIEPMVWHEMFDFTEDCVLLVLADTPYDESDYVRDAARFRALAG